MGDPWLVFLEHRPAMFGIVEDIEARCRRFVGRLDFDVLAQLLGGIGADVGEGLVPQRLDSVGHSSGEVSRR